MNLITKIIQWFREAELDGEEAMMDKMNEQKPNDRPRCPVCGMEYAGPTTIERARQGLEPLTTIPICACGIDPGLPDSLPLALKKSPLYRLNLLALLNSEHAVEKMLLGIQQNLDNWVCPICERPYLEYKPSCICAETSEQAACSAKFVAHHKPACRERLEGIRISIARHEEQVRAIPDESQG